MGRLIVEALLATGKHTVYIMTRKVSYPRSVFSLTVQIPEDQRDRQFLQTDYSKSDLGRLLVSHGVEVVICAFSLHYASASEAQIALIEACDACPSVKRFLPSEFNVDYDLPDDILPYPDKQYHQAARRALEKTSLEYSYIYPGMFMDYFGIPKVPTHLRELCFFIDPMHGKAAVPDDGSARMAMSYTTDVARYTALCLGLPRWPRVMTTAASTVSIHELVRLTETNLGVRMDVRYQPVEALREHRNFVLPENEAIAERFPARFPNGRDQLQGLIADLEAGVALGAFDFDNMDRLNLVNEFEAVEPMTIEVLLEKAWKR